MEANGCRGNDCLHMCRHLDHNQWRGHSLQQVDLVSVRVSLSDSPYNVAYAVLLCCCSGIITLLLATLPRSYRNLFFRADGYDEENASVWGMYRSWCVT